MSEKKKSPWRRYLYHTTTLDKLRSIARRGLSSNYRATFSGYAGHSAKRIFLTEKSAADCWYGKVKDIVEYGDREIEDLKRGKIIPILIRVDRDTLNPDLKLYVDQEGSRDCIGGKSFYVKRKIPAGVIEVWTGKDWQAATDFEAGVYPWKETFGEYAKFYMEGPKDDRYMTVDFKLPKGWKAY
jgi:hypothetical protein